MISKLDKKNILESKEIDISSIRGRIQLIIFPLLLIGYVTFCYYLFVVKSVEKFESNHYFAMAIASVGLFFFIFMYLRLHTAKLIGNKIIYKNLLKTNEFTVDKIIEFGTFRMKFVTYLSIKFQIKGRKKTIWIMKPGFLSFTTDPELLLDYSIIQNR